MVSVYSSPILVLLFVGFLALIVLFQLIPAFVLFYGMLKATMFKKFCTPTQI
jgi:hypothetical protein